MTLKYDKHLTLDFGDEALVYNELGLKPDLRNNNVSVICDLAILKKYRNGDKISIGIEIKSDKDNVARLDKQLEAYKKYFDYVYVVVTSKNIEGVVKKAGSTVGIILYEKEGQYKIIQTAKQIHSKESGRYWGKLLWLEELHEEFHRLKVDYKKNPLMRYKNQKVNKFNSLYLKQVRGISDYTSTKHRVYELLNQRVEDELKGKVKTKNAWGRVIFKDENYTEIKSGKE